MMNSRRILLIDDDVALGNLAQQMLEEAGFEVRYLPSLRLLKSTLTEWHPNLLLLDLEIGADNGLNALPTIQAIDPELPVIFISSHTDSNTAAKAINRGAISYLKKPFEMQELLAYVNRHTPVKTTLQQIGSYTLDIRNALLTRPDGSPIHLALKEQKLLDTLARRQTFLVTRQEIELLLWGDEKTNHNPSINNLISQLRTYFEQDPRVQILTLPKQGFILMVMSHA